MMYRIEMLVEVGRWSVQRYGARGHAAAAMRRTKYEWFSTDGAWVPIGGSYLSIDGAYEQIERFEKAGSRLKPKWFRVRWDT